jgi:hypothetical protein
LNIQRQWTGMNTGSCSTSVTNASTPTWNRYGCHTLGCYTSGFLCFLITGDTLTSLHICGPPCYTWQATETSWQFIKKVLIYYRK